MKNAKIQHALVYSSYCKKDIFRPTQPGPIAIKAIFGASSGCICDPTSWDFFRDSRNLHFRFIGLTTAVGGFALSKTFQTNSFPLFLDLAYFENLFSEIQCRVKINVCEAINWGQSKFQSSPAYLCVSFSRDIPMNHFAFTTRKSLGIGKIIYSNPFWRVAPTREAPQLTDGSIRRLLLGKWRKIDPVPRRYMNPLLGL